ncbi:MAG: bifunctional [glutamate--ammonia ligase]-adenylyl-L-tyrosine phosphorylase/[glutamate--ammonia-ligase] adenylyltransferase [Burkholderiales bacterium]
MAAPPSAPPAAGTSVLHSRFIQRLHRRYAQELNWLPAGVPTQAVLQTAFDALRARGDDLAVALRVLRQLTIERLARLDCEQQAELSVITAGMTDLAEFTLDQAATEVQAQLDALHGAPLDSRGRRVQLWIVGMGKLGARELNVSSDVDLIYVYHADGETAGSLAGEGRISNHEYFGKAAQRIGRLIGDTTEHGFVFRVDLALRPNGNSGPAAISLPALEEYFHAHGREWERFAWLKSRVVAPRACVEDGGAQALRGAVLPFVFRRYLDYNVFDALRVLHRQIREHAAKRCAGRPDRANDVKLSRGGIREIEFIVQLQQVVRGGQYPELRTRPTLQALHRLQGASLMAPATATALAAAYVFLRRVEHRIQYLDDQQTHVLPTRDDDLSWIAQTLGYEDSSDFLEQLDSHRERVAREFDTLLGGASHPCLSGLCNLGLEGSQPTVLLLEGLLGQLPPAVAARVALWQDNAKVQALRDDARTRLLRIVQRTSQWLLDGSVNEIGALRLIDWIEPLLRRESYLALLLERPVVHQRLLHLLGAAKWPARYLQRHPGVIDELANDAMLQQRFAPADYERELEARRASLAVTDQDDEETLMNVLRRAHHAELFRTLARDLEGKLRVEQVSDDLSALADATLAVTARWCWQRVKNRHREEPQFAILGYGKLGGKELSYGSDLDIVFLFDDEDERAPEIYAAYVRRIINWLSVKTGEGDLFEIDTALRPNGNSGMLVTSFTAFANYQERRGSNTAWVWEHQAMTRARFVLGLDDLRTRFDAVREVVVTAERDEAALRREIVAMREKLRVARPVRAGRFDVKDSRGAMLDAEFAVQFLVLAYSAQHRELVPNLGNITLMRLAEDAGLLPVDMGRAAGDAYRTLRRIQHEARLDERPTWVEATELQLERDAIVALWKHALGTAPST